ncbi:hypothetical protein OF846_000840 [Rhodotorula toruloides]|nr:hypothetical protein OF846_000840 [Rhodotorula toruloides]
MRASYCLHSNDSIPRQPHRATPSSRPPKPSRLRRLSLDSQAARRAGEPLISRPAQPWPRRLASLRRRVWQRLSGRTVAPRIESHVTHFCPRPRLFALPSLVRPTWRIRAWLDSNRRKQGSGTSHNLQ